MAINNTTSMPVAEWESRMTTNVKGIFHGLHYGLPTMIANGNGSFINRSSFAG
ncbi:SDR family NAD(P)-dependent oxidoreductase [Cytobacillus kochii]|uniref:SDR family NAD(P)-dependent oxidoreductase n=1 Tax=Cytobacillus kochii TaxID=859143 RepID=UPI002E20EDA6|nr:SDR family NAD(P)-dependent oxidoreductase [Cytobacillus kochii]